MFLNLGLGKGSPVSMDLSKHKEDRSDIDDTGHGIELEGIKSLRLPHPLGKNTPCRLLRHWPSTGRKVYIHGPKKSGFNVSSAYVLKATWSVLSQCG